jgi:hypothetical protein
MAASLDVAFGSIQKLGLYENHRVVVTNRRFQQPLCIMRSGGRDHFQSRHVTKPGFQTLRMLSGKLVCCAAGSANYHGNRNLSSGHISNFGGIIDDLIQGQDAEIKGHQLDDRPQSSHGGPNSQAGKPRFGNRRIPHSFRSEFLDEPFTDLKGSLIVPDFFSYQKHARIPLHFFTHRLVQRFSVRKVHRSDSNFMCNHFPVFFRNRRIRYRHPHAVRRRQETDSPPQR